MTVMRGVLLAIGARTHSQLTQMTWEDQRNTLIVELSGRTSESVAHYQAMDNATLEGVGAVYAFMLAGGIRTRDQLRTMSDDGCRNTLIVELDGQTHLGARLQGHSNLQLVLIGLGSLVDSQQLGTPASFIRGVLLAGGFRTHQQLNAMSHEAQRNTLIVELTGRTNQANYQSYDDRELAGAGALLVFLRKAGIRTDAQVKTLTADDMRNLVIVEIDAQTGHGKSLQGWQNIDLVRVGLGVDQAKLVNRSLPLGAQPTTVHFKSLLPMSDQRHGYLLRQFVATYDLFQPRVAVSLGSFQDLSGRANAALLKVMDVGACTATQGMTSDQTTLYAERDGVGTNDVVVYLVTSLVDGISATNLVGCASHPAGQPGCAVVEGVAEWLVAHEVGHVLDLVHVDATVAANSRFLMWPNVGWTGLPPDITEDEFKKMIASSLTPVV